MARHFARELDFVLGAEKHRVGGSNLHHGGGLQPDPGLGHGCPEDVARANTRRLLQVTCSSWLRAPVIISAVLIVNRRVNQFINVKTVQAPYVDVVVRYAAHVRHIDPSKRVHSAVLAEKMVGDRIVPSVIG